MKGVFQPLVMSNADNALGNLDAVFLATPHEVSHIAEHFLQKGVKVFDLSIAFH